MANIEAVAIGETRDHLTEDADSFGLRQLAVSRYMVEELATFDKLKNKVSWGSGQSIYFRSEKIGVDLQFTSVLPDIIKTNDIWMFN